MPDQLPDHKLWFRGPTFHWPPENEWPADLIKLQADFELNNDELLKGHKVSHTKCKVSHAGEVCLKPMLNYFSTLSKPERAVAWLAKLPTIRSAKMKRKHDSWGLGTCLSEADLKSATSDIIKLVQKEYFPANWLL